MRTTAIINFKGGTGKTVTAVNVASELASRGKRVLVIDADPQGNSTEFFGVEPKDCGTLYELLTRQQEPGYWEWITPITDHLSMIPASMDLILADVRALRDNTAHLLAIRELTEVMAEDDYADFCLIDCPAYLTAATSAALAAADDVIIPIRVDAFSLHGMDELLRQIKGMREFNPRLRISGALITMDRSGTIISRAAKEALLQSAVPVYATSILFTEAVSQSISAHKPLREVKTKYAGIAAANYAAVVDEYLQGGASYGV